MDDNKKVNLPQPDEVSYKDKENAFGSYIMMFAGAYFPLPLVEFICSLVYYFYYKKRSRYVAFHSLQSLLAQLPFTIMNAVIFIWGIILIVAYHTGRRIITSEEWKAFAISLLLIILLNIIYIIVSLVIAIKAKRGVISYFPIVGKISFELFYGDNAIDIVLNKKSKITSNNPPS